MLPLVLALAALAVGPLVYRLVPARTDALSVLDAFVYVAILGLLGASIVPDAVHHGGPVSLLLVGLGFVGPALVEKASSRIGHEAHRGALALALSGIAVHSLLDGIALGAPDVAHDHGHRHGLTLLPLAVILHRVPVGLAIWWLVRRGRGGGLALALLGTIAASTVVGFVAGPGLLTGVSMTVVAWFQALVAGSLLHVVVHLPHEHTHAPEERRVVPGWPAGLGALLGVAVLVVLLASEAAGSAGGRFSARLVALAIALSPIALSLAAISVFAGRVRGAAMTERVARESAWLVVGLLAAAAIAGSEGSIAAWPPWLQLAVALVISGVLAPAIGGAIQPAVVLLSGGASPLAAMALAGGGLVAGRKRTTRIGVVIAALLLGAGAFAGDALARAAGRMLEAPADPARLALAVAGGVFVAYAMLRRGPRAFAQSLTSSSAPARGGERTAFDEP